MTTKTKEYSPFPEANYYAALAEQAAKENLKLFVFFPESISLQKRKIIGYEYLNGQWSLARYPFPDIVYDRVFYNSSYYHKNKQIVKMFKQVPEINFMNRGLPSKWELFQQLKLDHRLRPHLPRQELFTNADQLSSLLKHENSLIIKPIAGGFGKKVFHLIKGQPAILEGRNAKNQFFRRAFGSTKEAIDFLAPKLNQRYLLQQYLELNSPDGHPYDVRVFAQKNEQGEWRVIGKGIRLGPKNKLTSNIRGGGNAEHFHSFVKQIHPDQFEKILTSVENIGILVPQVLEKKYHPLFEIGIDVGIDRYGGVWIIEANAKPGRKIFELMGDHQTSQQAILGPIKYARYVLQREQGGSE